jgi:hypothetical protein
MDRETLQEYIDMGMVDPKSLAESLICWLSQDDIKRFCQINEIWSPEQLNELMAE